MKSNTVNHFLHKRNLVLDSRYLKFIKSDYLTQISQTVHHDNEDWLINRIERPFTNRLIISDDFDSIESCLRYFGTDIKNPMLISEIFYKEDELISKWEDFSKYHRLHKKGFLIIGYLDLPHSSILLIGIDKLNFGQIWMAVGNSTSLIKIANEINDFVKEFRFGTFNILTKKFGLEFVKEKEGY